MADIRKRPGRNGTPYRVRIRVESHPVAAVERATLEWVAWFNKHRLMAPIGSFPAADAEAADYRNLDEQAVSV
ncbi:MAG: hypothetical protein KDH17_10950 [Rhodocyclaceae bacterium]|nr:hypothetical protein [Rhodocyclaceae bacterium]MCP5233650.1 hypothetical protein [Zoogloeaceae bacterium]